MSRVRMPTFILIFFLIDVALAIAYLSNYLAGYPYRPLTVLLALNEEANLPAWYSSIQWFCVAALLGIFAHHNFDPSQKKSWLLVLFPLVFLAFSLDEVAQIHEWLGRKSDRFLLPGGSRRNTLFSHTGIWMVALGVPFLAFFVGLLFSLRPYFQGAPGAFVKMLWGMALMLTGALGVETLSNFVELDSVQGVLQVFSEELCEMLGGTVVLWGSYELLCRYGLTLRFDMVETEESAPPRRNSASL